MGLEREPPGSFVGLPGPGRVDYMSFALNSSSRVSSFISCKGQVSFSLSGRPCFLWWIIEERKVDRGQEKGGAHSDVEPQGMGWPWYKCPSVSTSDPKSHCTHLNCFLHSVPTRDMHPSTGSTVHYSFIVEIVVLVCKSHTKFNSPLNCICLCCVLLKRCLCLKTIGY